MLPGPDIPALSAPADKSGYHVEAGGLSGAVGSEQSDYLALLHVDGYAFHNSSGSVFLDKVIAVKFHNTCYLTSRSRSFTSSPSSGLFFTRYSALLVDV